MAQLPNLIGRNSLCHVPSHTKYTRDITLNHTLLPTSNNAQTHFKKLAESKYIIKNWSFLSENIKAVCFSSSHNKPKAQNFPLARRFRTFVFLQHFSLSLSPSSHPSKLAQIYLCKILRKLKGSLKNANSSDTLMTQLRAVISLAVATEIFWGPKIIKERVFIAHRSRKKLKFRVQELRKGKERKTPLEIMT